MIKYVCDTCGAELSARSTLLKISTVSELFGTETALCSSEYDLCEECERRIRGAAERHSWEEEQTAPREEPETKERPAKEEPETKERPAKEEPAADIVPAEEQKKKKRGRKARAASVDHGKIVALKNAGWPVKEICAEMHVSPATVFNHLKMEKAGEVATEQCDLEGLEE